MRRRPVLALIDGDPRHRDATAGSLALMGYEVRTASAPAGIERLGPDVVVLDMDLGGLGDVAGVIRLRDATSAAILGLTASRDPVDRIAALEGGADDVAVKPLAFQELAARIGGLVARRGGAGRDVLRLECVTIDFAASCLLRLGEAPERLGPGEVALLRVFARNPNRVLTRDDLLAAAPADSEDANDRAIDNRVVRLRRKLATRAIVTVRRHGYMFVPP